MSLSTLSPSSESPQQRIAIDIADVVMSLSVDPNADEYCGAAIRLSWLQTSSKFPSLLQVLARGHIALEGAYKGHAASRVLLRPLTGRRHQIRVHLQQSGYPIVGDAAYSEDGDSHRMFLLAHELYVPLKERPLDLHLAEPPAWKRALTIPDTPLNLDQCCCGRQ